MLVLSNVPQIVAVGLVPGKTYDLAIAKIAKQGYVALADRPANIPLAGHLLGLAKKIGCGLIGRDPLAQYDAVLLCPAGPPGKSAQQGGKSIQQIAYQPDDRCKDQYHQPKSHRAQSGRELRRNRRTRKD